MSRFFPFLAWRKQLTPAAARADCIAGITVALVLIPQSMAYAQLAGLPAYYGLYAAFLPPVAAALFGSSRQLATGPVAIASLLTAAALEPLAAAGSEAFIAYAVLLSLISGLVQLGLGVARLGVVVNFLSVPVVNAYTNAAAIIIATSQLSKFFGVTADSSNYHFLTVFRVLAAAMTSTHWPTLGLGCLTLALMAGLKRLGPKIPNVLGAAAIVTFLSWALGYQRDREVSSEAIRSPQALETLTALKAAEAERVQVAEQRAALAPRVREAERRYGHFAPQALAERHALDLLEARVDQLKKEIPAARQRLREFQFEAVETQEGPVVFYAKGEVPQGQKGDGRVWRLRVSDSPVDDSALSLSGGGAVVGRIPRRLPGFRWPSLAPWAAIELLPMAIVIALLGYMEAMSIAKAMAARTGQRLDPNQELIGQGLAKIAGSFFQSYPVSGSFSRSALNLEAGAKTGLSSVFASLMVGATLLFFTPALHHLPESALAAVIMMAVIGLVNVRGAIHAWQVHIQHGIIGAVTFVSTLVLAPHLEIGLLLGVVLSLGLFIYRRMRPVVAALSKHPDGTFRDAARHGLRTCPHVAVIRFDGSLFFANTSYLEDQILDRVASMPQLRHFLIVCDGINDLDASGEDMLSRQVDQLRSAGYEISFCGLRGTVMDVLRRTSLCSRIGSSHLFPNIQLALREICAKAHEGSDEKDCPLLAVRYAP